MNKKNVFTSAFSIILLAALTLLPYVSYSKLTAYNRRVSSFTLLKKNIRTACEEFSGDCALIIKDLTYPDIVISHNPTIKIPAASLLKLPILACGLKAVDDGKISLDKRIIIRRKDITGGSGIIKAMELPLEVTFGHLLKLMISQSDNTATNKVIDILGFDYINAGFEEFGLGGTVLARKMMDFSQRRKGIENYTTASDLAYLLEGAYNGSLINRRFSQLCLSFLKEQKVQDRIPLYLPKNTVIAHKTGLERGVIHDAGIVFAPGGDYIICVLTSRVKDSRKAKKFIAKLSLLTYNLYLAGGSSL